MSEEMKSDPRGRGLSSLWSRYDLSGVAANVGQLMGRNLILLVISLGVASLMAAVFTREQYGTYQFVIGVVAGLSFLSLLGSGPVIMQETAKGNHGTFVRAFKWQLLLSPLYSVALLALAGYYYYVADKTAIALCFAATSAFFPLKTVLVSYQSYVLGRQNYSLYARLPVLVSLGVAVATALAVWITRSPAPVLLVVGVVTVAMHLLAFKYVFKTCPPENDSHHPSSIRFGFGLSALYITPTISAQLGTLLVGTLLSMENVAVLVLAVMPLQKSKALLDPLREYFSPRVVSKTGSRMFRGANRVILAYMSVALAYVLIAVAVMPLFFRIFFPDYMDAIPLARLAMFCLLPGAPAAIMELTIYSERRLRQTGVIRLAQFIFDLAVAVVFIYKWGVLGAIIARFAAGLLRTCVVSVFYGRNLRQARRSA